MNFLKRVIAKLDTWQQRHRLPGFLYALVKKYSEDDAAYQGALITYYGFLSLFPLLLVAASILQLVLTNNVSLRQELIGDITSYFPVVGNQIQGAVNAPSKTGWALLIGTIITLYGARGAADALRHALNHIWQVPRPERPSFPKGPLKSLAIILVGGVGLLGAAVLSTLATGLEHVSWLRLFPSLVSIIVLFGVFWFIFRFGMAKKLSWSQLWPGAVVAAVGIQILQIVGGFVITHELKNFSNLYGTFALVLGIMAWIYLQAQVIVYAAEVNAVLNLKLWPRSLQANDLTSEDRRALRKFAKKEKLHPDEKVTVRFPSNKQDR